MEKARCQVPKLLGCNKENIIFTSGGTEGNNLAIKGFAQKLYKKSHFITSAVEHPSILKVFKLLEQDGHEVTYLPVTREGLLFSEQLEEAINNHKETALMSLMMANNEIGVLFPIKKIGKIARKY